MKIPPPPRGLPRRLRGWYVVITAIGSVVASVVVPMCPVHDGSGLPAWRVQAVNDGDTVTCLDTGGRVVKVRLVGIDAPEYDQPHGGLARQALAGKLSGGVVRVEGTARDQHGRLLGTLWLEGRNLNRELVAEGHAWSFGGFSEDEELAAAEEAARRERRGLWAAPQPVRPADWRALHPSHGG